jgi:hypothetical protein
VLSALCFVLCALCLREAFSGARNEETGVKSVERTDVYDSEEYKNGNQLRNIAFRVKIFKKIVRHKSEKNSKIDDELRRSLSHSVANEMGLKKATIFRCSTVKAEVKS